MSDSDAGAPARSRDGSAIVIRESATCLWLIGWLFTVAFAQLGFWHSVLAMLVWPYFLGAQLAGGQ